MDLYSEKAALNKELDADSDLMWAESGAATEVQKVSRSGCDLTVELTKQEMFKLDKTQDKKNKVTTVI